MWEVDGRDLCFRDMVWPQAVNGSRLENDEVRRIIYLTFKQGSYSAPLTYQSYSGETTFSIQDVRALVRVANSCEYRLKVECHDAPLSAYSYWVTYANEEKNFYETTGTFCEYFRLSHFMIALHYSDIIMSTMASQVSNLSVRPSITPSLWCYSIFITVTP